MQKQIEEMVCRFVDRFSRQSVTSWRRPLFAYASAGDPLFARLKEVASPGHALPDDFLPGAKTVMTYFLPFDSAVEASNIKGRYSSKTWAVAYIETNRLINALNPHLRDEIAAGGYRAAYVPATHNFDVQTLLSDWSHRHAAYIAGLGTFGLNRMLITTAGCCGRIGSVVTDLEIEPTARYDCECCLFKADGSCARCVEKCVNQALREEGLDKQLCHRMLLENAERLSDLEGIADVCGKCLVGTPCATGIPGQAQP